MTANEADRQASHWAERSWQVLRDLSDRTSLRTKLITGLLALVIAAVAAISISSVWVLRSYLTSQDDSQLKNVYNALIDGGQAVTLTPGTAGTGREHGKRSAGCPAAPPCGPS